MPAKIAPKVTTYASLFNAALSRYSIEEVMRDVPVSNYPFKEGEALHIGNLKDARVEEMLMEGRLIHASYHDAGEQRGIAYDNGRRPWVGWWMEAEPATVEGKTHFSEVSSYLRASYSSTALSGLLHHTYSRGLLDCPEYQRDYVWTLEDKQKLLGSVFNGFDIGKFIFLEYEHPEWRLEIVDGKQRIRTLREYWEGRFAYEGKTFFELSRHDKRAFEELTVQFSSLKSKYLKKSDLLWLFLSVNSGGVPQTEAHIARVQKLYKEQLKLESTDLK